jgi:hypothetical protein
LSLPSSSREMWYVLVSFAGVGVGAGVGVEVVGL